MKLNNENRKEFYKKLVIACKNGDIGFINEVINSETVNQITNPTPAAMLQQAANYGHLDIVQGIYTSNQLKKHLEKNDLLDAIRKAFLHSHLEVIQFLAPKLEWFGSYDNFISLCVSDATVAGQIKIVKAFFEDNLVKHNLNKDLVTTKIINMACSHNKLDIIKYVMEKEQYKYFDKNAHNLNNTFATALMNENLDVIQYLIFDLNISKTKEINNILENNTDNNFEKVKNWFKIRDANKELEAELPILNQETNPKKPKM